MSRLTAPPFARYTPLIQTVLPPSPPDTLAETMASGPTMPAHTPIDIPVDDTAAELGTPRKKRTPSVTYNTHFQREREKPIARNAKSLMIIVPPSNLLQDHPQLASGPFNRMLQGVMMPLFPSMFAQLTAIAREYNFPSTAGLSLYIQHTENGQSFSPRISEECWPIIWHHFSDNQAPVRPLISGRLEFDIDIRIARWYTAWISSLLRESMDYSVLAHPTTAPSISHQRSESKSTVALPAANSPEDSSAISSPIQQRAVPRRHVPRKLSLVERFELPSTHGDHRSDSRELPTILQEEEPRTAMAQLTHRVESWRDNAIPARSPLVGTGQTSLDPVNLPNHIEIETPSTPAEEELNLEDYQWEPSSAGPSSGPLDSPVSWGRLPSVTFEARLEGSVCTTASICTSFGPLDYDPLSPVSSDYRLPSPDLANRMFNSVPSTPSVHTSFGPSDYDPFSPVLSVYSRIPSPDLGARMFESAPITPMTATSWGPGSPLPSPRCTSPTPSLDLGERCYLADMPGPKANQRPDLASISTPWNHVWPYSKSTGYPHFDLYPAEPWKFVWPYFKPAGYPHFDIYPAIVTAETKEPSPSAKAWNFVWPYFKPSGYPHFDIYPGTEAEDKCLTLATPWNFVWPYFKPSGYPHFDIYPSASRKDHTEEPLTTYPMFNLYPAIYPHNLDEIYPTVVSDASQQSPREIPSGGKTQSRSPASVHLNLYPALNPYPAVYPHFDLYPAIQERRKVLVVGASAGVNETSTTTGYPFFNIYPLVYPHFDLYPAIALAPKNVSQTKAARSIPSLVVGSQYPSFNLYPPVYPNFTLYPPKAGDVVETPCTKAASAPVPVIVGSQYPTFNLYPPVYPFFDLYPAPALEKTTLERAASQLKPVSVKLPAKYPRIQLYAPVYPHFEIYPAMYPREASVASSADRISIRGSYATQYPYFNLYPAVYPQLEIYPKRQMLLVHRPLLPSMQTKCDESKGSRLTHSELHAMVMMESMGGRMSSFTAPDWVREDGAFKGRSRSGSIKAHRSSVGLVRTMSSRASDESTHSTLAYRTSLRQSSLPLRPRLATPPNIAPPNAAPPNMQLPPIPAGISPENVSPQRRMSIARSGLPSTPRRRDSIVMQMARTFEATS